MKEQNPAVNRDYNMPMPRSQRTSGRELDEGMELNSSDVGQSLLRRQRGDVEPQEESNEEE